MAAELRQFQRQVQELRITPQLQQAIKLLQLSRMELAEVIQQELTENPFLEESPDLTDAPVENDQLPGIDRVASSDAREAGRSEEQAHGEKAVEEIDWERYLENMNSPMPGSAAGGGEELPGLDQTLTQREDLTEHLLWQVGVSGCSESVRRGAEAIIQNLDENGYLQGVDLPDISMQHGVLLDDVETALALVQGLDPVGVGARDLRECLLLQARALHPDSKLLHQIIDQHLPDLERRNHSGIARALGVSRDEVLEAHRELTTLDPKPGRQFVREDPAYITPDIYIVRQDDGWMAVLNEDGMPRLRVSEYYRRALRSPTEKDAKNYVQERLRSAWWLIRSIQQRQRTILRVTEAIIKFQRGFLDHGIDHLRPLVLRDVADEIGMHESTISRVTSNKYVHTPRGIYELKFFFDSSIRTHGGDDVAAEAVKHHIRQLIAAEPPKRPHSDEQLVALLRDKHRIEIARRTVAKYRESMGILASSRRKHFS
jgi:RNA polymerase sigma-54 factor